MVKISSPTPCHCNKWLSRCYKDEKAEHLFLILTDSLPFFTDPLSYSEDPHKEVGSWYAPEKTASFQRQ